MSIDNNKIVILPNFISKFKNGKVYVRNTEISIFNQLTHLGFDVFVFGNVSKKENELLKSPFVANNNLNFIQALRNWKWKDRLLGPILFLFKFIKLSFKKHLIYIYLPYTYALILYPFLTLRGNYALYIRGNIYNTNPLFLILYKKIIKKSNFNLCTGKHVTNICKSLNQKSFEVVQDLSISVVLESKPKTESESINILYLSGISQGKGIIDLLNIANKVLADFPNVYITIAGSGPQNEMNYFYLPIYNYT